MVSDFLVNNFSPERRQLLEDAILVAAEFNIADVPNEIENIISDDELGRDNHIAMVNDIVREALIEILNYHSIVVLDLTRDIALLTDMVRALQLVSEEYDPDYLKANIDFELSETNEAIDIWVAIVTLLTYADEDEVYKSIFEVDDVIITNILSVLNSKTVTLPPDDNNEYITRYRKYLTGRRTGLVYDLVRGGVVLGSLDFNSLFVLLEDKLYTLPKNEIIFEIISLMLISDAEPEEYRETIDKASRLLTNNEAEAKLLAYEIRTDYQKYMGIGV